MISNIFVIPANAKIPGASIVKKTLDSGQARNDNRDGSLLGEEGHGDVRLQLFKKYIPR